MNPAETIQRLLALANDEAGAIEERRTAAMQAARLIHTHGFGASNPVVDPLGERLEYLDRMAKRHDQTAATRAMLNGVHERIWEYYPRAEHCSGRAELSMLLHAAVGTAYLIAIDPERPPQHEVGEFLALLPTVVQAFDAWAAQQPVPPAEQIQAEIMEKYGEWREPLPPADRIACALGVPSPNVAEALESLVRQGRLRGKSGRHTIVRRPTRPKSRMVQEDLFR